VEQHFDKYSLLKIKETPEIDVTVVESTASPERTIESGLANIAPSFEYDF
jgi:CO/xanthine dehydrogenase Mo-binding subunit